MADALLAGDTAVVRTGLLPMIDLNPISWLGDAASAAVADVWKAAMIALWSAGLWLLTLAFRAPSRTGR
jgi:type IV secretion system protein TrbL